MKTLEIARFEVAYRLRRPATWVYAVMLTVLPILVMQAVADAPRAINAPITIAGAMALVGIAGMLVSAAIFGDAATRDVEAGTQPLFFTVPLHERQYLGGRFLGAFAANLILVLFAPIGLLLGTLMPYELAVTFVPFDARAYVEPFLSILLPNLFFTAAILFAVAASARSTLAAYFAAVALFAGYLIAVDWQARLDNRQLVTLLDPFGAIVVQQLVSYLPQAAQDTTRVGLSPILLWNRAIWISIGTALLALLAYRYRFSLAAASPRRRGSRRVGAPEARPQVSAAPPVVRREFGRRLALRQMLSVARSSLVDIMSRRLFLIVLAAGVILVFAFGWDVGAIVFDTSTWPMTHLVASVMRGPAALAVVVLISVYAGELVWTDRDRRVAEIVDTAPVPTWALLAGKFIALVAMIVVLQVAFMLAGIALQLVQGFYAIEPRVYVSYLFGFLLASYLLFAVLALAAHVVLNSKPLGHLFVVLFFVVVILAGTELGLRHNLLKYGAAPEWVYSDMNGFGPFVAPFVWFKLYWSAWALLLAIAAALFWVRGTEPGLRQRMAQARLRLTARALGAVAVAAVLIVSLGGFIFYNTNVLNRYESPEQGVAAAAAYERKYRKFEDAPQPTIVSADLRIEIFPDRGSVDLGGTYRMVNRSGQPIRAVHVAANENVTVRSLVFDRPARLEVDDRGRHQYRIYALQRGLEPGDTLRLTFDHAFRRRGFPNSGINTSVAENGAYFDRRWLPRIGYQPRFELDDEDERKAHGLAPRDMPGQDAVGARQYRFHDRDADVVSVDAVIGTAADQIAITTGRLVREWRENGRRYFHYRTDAPLMFAVPVLSARYAVREDRWNDVALKIFHHPAHAFNLDRMFKSMKASLDYFTREFGPYQFTELRIVEFPRYANFARAHPHTIAFSEGGAFLTRVKEGDVDRPFFVVAHETAHQWWGGQISAPRVRGGALLSETLAQYGAMMVMEKTYGREHVRKFYGFEIDRYLRGRSLFRIAEDPLLQMREQSYLYYNKGGVVMYSLKEQIGEERVNAALRSFLRKWRDAGPPYPTATDLYREFQAETPDSLKYLLSDLFETITLWDVRVAAATAERVGPSDYRVTLEVEGRKLQADSAGKETETPMNDLVEIGIFPAGQGKELGEPLYLRRHRIRSGVQRIVVSVARQPARVGVDPYDLLIQRERDRKVVALKELGSRDDSAAWRAEFRGSGRDSVRLKLRAPNF